MYDFHKASLTLSPNLLLNNQNLSFKCSFDKSTSEIDETIYITELNNLKISIKEKRYISLWGSFHKYYNEGKTNETDYNVQEFYNTISSLWEIAQINPFSVNIHNLEFGVNVCVPFEVKSFITQIIGFKTKTPSIHKFRNGGLMMKFVFKDNYEVKIYDKGTQYNLSYNLLRFEIKVRKMQYFKTRKIIIRDYYDLLRAEVINSLKLTLVNTFNEMKYFYCEKSDKIKKRDYQLIINGQNEVYWKELRKKNLNKYKKQRKEFRELIARYSDNSKFKIVKELLEKKLNEITIINDKLQLRIDSLYNNFGFSNSTYLLPREISSPYPYLFTTSNSKLSRVPQNNCYTFGRVCINQC